MSTWKEILLAAVLVLVWTCQGRSEQLAFSFSDPVGDWSELSPDITSLYFLFDNTTGAYSIDLSSDSDVPFRPTSPNQLRINVNVFNADVGTLDQDPSFFSQNDSLNWLATTTTLRLDGVDPRLTHWNEGDRVALSSVLGNPTGIGAFGSSAGITRDRLTFGKDIIASDEFTTLARVPEPTSGGLALCFGLFFVSILRRRCRL